MRLVHSGIPTAPLLREVSRDHDALLAQLKAANATEMLSEVGDGKVQEWYQRPSLKYSKDVKGGH
jgi:hypothetical protein